MMGGALGLAVLASLAASRTDSLRADGGTRAGGAHRRLPRRVRARRAVRRRRGRRSARSCSTRGRSSRASTRGLRPGSRSPRRRSRVGETGATSPGSAVDVWSGAALPWRMSGEIPEDDAETSASGSQRGTAVAGFAGVAVLFGAAQWWICATHPRRRRPGASRSARRLRWCRPSCSAARCSPVCPTWSCGPGSSAAGIVSLCGFALARRRLIDDPRRSSRPVSRGGAPTGRSPTTSAASAARGSRSPAALPGSS